MLLNVLSRDEDGCNAMRQLIADCHHPEAAKPAMRHQAWQLFRALVERDIIDLLPPGSDRKLQVNVELQDDFSLNQSLSLYCLDTLMLLDADAPDFVFKLLSLVESILEHPMVILQKQVDKLKRDKLAEMKAAGIEYDERMAKLDEIDYAKPESDFIYETFNQFVTAHPWVGNESIRPKSIAREMYETYSSFGDYVSTYGLQRAEGVLLRHLTGVYRFLEQTIPPMYKTETVADAIIYLEELLKVTDSSLIDEWELLRNPDRVLVDRAMSERPRDITKDREGFLRLVRHEALRFVVLLAHRDYEGLTEQFDLSELFSETDWPGKAFEALMAPYYDGHERIRLDPSARAKHHTRINADDPERWLITQTLVDDNDDNDYACSFALSVEHAKEAGAVRLRPLAVSPMP
jgi:hypothetical protein